MAISVFSGNYTTTGTTGGQSVTGIPFAPKAVIVYGPYQSTPDTESNAQGFLGVATDESQIVQQSYANYSGDGITSTVAATRQEPAFASMIGSAGQIIERLVLTSFTAGGFAFTANVAAKAFRFGYLAFGGADLTFKVVEWDARSGQQVIGGAGFRPAAAFTFSNYLSGASANVAQSSVGAFDGISQECIAYCVQHNETGGAGSNAAKRYSSQNAAVYYTPTVTALATAAGFTVDGMILNWAGSPSGRFLTLFMGGNQVSSRVGRILSPATDQTIQIPTTNMVPQGSFWYGNSGTGGESLDFASESLGSSYGDLTNARYYFHNSTNAKLTTISAKRAANTASANDVVSDRLATFPREALLFQVNHKVANERIDANYTNVTGNAQTDVHYLALGDGDPLGPTLPIPEPGLGHKRRRRLAGSRR